MSLLARLAIAATIASTCAAAAAAPVELLTNGAFSSGLAGWTVVDAAGGDGSWFADAVGSTTPLSGFATSGLGGGAGLYAVTDQGGPGSHVLSQAFTVAAGDSVLVVFKMFANDWSNSGAVNNGTLDFASTANQHVRVDLMKASAGAFSVAAADIAMTLLDPFVDLAADPNRFRNYSFDITSAVSGGGTYVLRFAEVDNLGNFNVGVDNVQVLATAAVPEPATLALVGLALVGVGATSRRRRTA